MPAPIRRHLEEARANLDRARGALTPGCLADAKALAEWRWSRDQAVKDCALQLREAVEILAYDRLLSRKKYLDDYEVNPWQPPKVVKIIADLIDDGIIHDSEVRIREQADPNTPNVTGDPVMALVKNGIALRDISKIYNSLGSLLHIAVPTDRTQLTTRISVAPEAAIAILENAVSFLEKFEGGADFHMIDCISFTCGQPFNNQPCSEYISRPVAMLEKQPIVSCPACRTDFMTFKDEQGFRFEPATFKLKCKCNGEIFAPITEIAKMKRDYERKRNPIPLHESATKRFYCTTPACDGEFSLELGIRLASRDPAASE